MDGLHRIRRPYVTRATISMMTFSHGPRFAAHGRNGIAKQQRKKFLSRAGASDASLMHENNLIDQ
jgi:hypothetical protein